MLASIQPYLPQLSPGASILVAAVVFAAGVLRGFTGFGFSLAAVPAITLFVDPAEAVPAIVIVAAVAGAELLPKAWRAVHWPSMGLLLAGAAAAAPLGTYALKALPADIMRAIIGAVVLAAVGLLWRGFRLETVPPGGVRLGIGALSGLLNGATGMGGPPVIIYFLATPAGAAIGRASLMVYFFLLSTGSTVVNAAGGLVDIGTIVFAGLMIPFMAAGNRVGGRWFDKASTDHYRRVALWCLSGVAVLGIGRALL